MSVSPGGPSTLVHSLATLLRNNGDSVLDGTSTLTLQVSYLQHLTQLFEQHLLSRTHQHGFLALPSHPADTTSLLQVQFLFDILQKAISVKLINPPGSRLQSVVTIFPFKSLKRLELKRIPPHCLEGLRGVYSQLEVFTCSRSLTSLEELLSMCGGDLSSALPWLELHTLNFSYNSISCLDESLSLLNVLRSLDLSHNKIQDCAEFLKCLSELEHLNLSYNNLQRAPELGLSARGKLVTLILRNNELETINGVEQLASLRHLDLAYNLLMEHSQLSPLSILHSLNTLVLEGNPLYFQKTHRTSTVCHLSRKAAFQRLRLDGVPLTAADLSVLPKPGQRNGQLTQTVYPVPAVPEPGVEDVSSGGGEFTDSVSVSEAGLARNRKKKSRSKVRVRRASISEPSDTDYDSRGQASHAEIVLHHQKDIERMDSFREKLGEDWLRYQHHLDGPQTEKATAQVLVNSHGTPSPPPPAKPDSQPPPPESLPPPLLASEPKRKGGEEEEEKDEEEGSDPEPETESTLQWTGHSPPNTESTLETSLAEPQPPDGEHANHSPHEEPEEELGVDLCLPLLVGVLSDDEEQSERKASQPFFLRVKQGHLLEVDMHQGRVRTRLELDSLREVAATQVTWTEKGEEKLLPGLELHFRYINREKCRRCYAMLDDDPQQAVETLTDILSHVAEENERQIANEKPRSVRLQCLKCREEFFQREPTETGRTALSEPDDSLLPLRLGTREGQEGGVEEREDRGNGEENTVICSKCGSDHVVQLAGQSAPSTSTPVPPQAGQTGDTQRFTFDETETPVQPHQNILDDPSVVQESPLRMTGVNESSTADGEPTDAFHTATSNLSVTGDSEGRDTPDHIPSQPITKLSFHTPDNHDRSAESREEELAGSYCYTGPQNPLPFPLPDEGSDSGQFDLLCEEAETVDHRLKLFLDVEVFEGEEELRCFLKMSTVKFGNPVEFPSLMVVTDQSIYILEITSQSEGQPSDWLQKRVSHRVKELSYLEVGLGSQSVHMEFDEGGAAYTLLVRDDARCTRFFGRLTAIVRELAHKSDSKLKSISTTRLTPQHRLWPLVCEESQASEEEDCSPAFFYLLAFLCQDGAWSSVTVLVTRETLYLLDEDHQWSKSRPEPTANEDGQTCVGRVTIRETQPISCVSSIGLTSSDPCRVDIKLYDEMAKEERTWALQAENGKLVQGLVDWVKSQWEAMFGVKLTTSVQ
ncbi:LOW QUALITY PROTEIN: serine/threonine-protein kinase 11-interacting protein [Chanos chanos]|uniref:Serine/threonine-protein kinase 11-interacting protein n=1 Tax=Chanos chanos TaxID=29144 RepID=A0A6J2W4Q8_CHACN|nr:LOW QUALITY PROTEIN: serine/threonine-protein kinase 11-interacting protein [Chanos chanos]